MAALIEICVITYADITWWVIKKLVIRLSARLGTGGLGNRLPMPATPLGCQILGNYVGLLGLHLFALS